jgi:flagellar motor switch protein FliG
VTPKGELTGAQRAAAFLLGLDKDAAADVIKHVDERVIVEVVEAMSRLDPQMLAPENLRKLDRELIKSLKKPRVTRIRSQEELRAMLEQTLGKAQAASLYDKIQQRLVQERPFIAIERERADLIAEALASESDAVAALVLSHLDPSLSAEVLGLLGEERAIAVVQRMAALVPPAPETLAAIAGDLKERLGSIAAGPAAADPTAQLRTVAEVLTYAAAEIEKSVLDHLQRDDARVASTIRELMFTWEDLAHLDRRAMQKVLSSVDVRTLSIALKASSPPVESAVLSALSTRVRAMITEERELAGAVPMKDVLAARANVMLSVRGLLESGEIGPARAGEELVT